MSNIEPKCSYPECVPACRKDCPPAASTNIEPTDITRTMRCTTCSVVGTHTINASMRNEAVLCPTCAESGKRSACVVTPIEPTEEQWQTARDLCSRSHIFRAPTDVEALARLLAEREAKLREDVDANIRLRVAAEDRTRLLQGLANTARAEADTLRARVAELEAKANEACRWCAEEDYCDCLGCGGRLPVVCVVAGKCARCSKAQHLADIKAGRKAVAAWLDDPWLEGRRKLGEDFMSTTAHYDDAKAAEGGEG